MYQHDPYAGQYPQPPPPLTSLDSESFHYNNNINTSSPIPNHYNNAEFTHYNNNNYNNNNTYNAPIQQEEDPNSLAAYLRREREEYLAHKYHPKVTPVEPIHHFIPYTAKPPPFNETSTYKPRPYVQKNRNCCCYNPAMTCCSCFCMLISLAFVAAGIALVVASKIMEEKCSYQCDSLIPQAQCGTICNSILHDGMFYGGIAVAGLAALSVVWRIIRWTCAGCSQH
ncbi:hypothetical protein K501DRAFT_338399 [Backusella circina FSU 941]|nr:hypothetical protein K501DRAFT_338399 [Backusella circina FSU 941]